MTERTGSQAQLAAVGADDLYIASISTEVSHFRSETKAVPEPFFVVPVDVPCTTGPGLLRTSVPLAGTVLLDVSLKLAAPVANPFSVFKRVRLLLDNQVLVDHESLWHDILGSFDRNRLTDTVFVPLSLVRLPLTPKTKVELEFLDLAVDATAIVRFLFLDTPVPFPVWVPFSTVRDSDTSVGDESVSLRRINGPVTGLVWASWNEGDPSFQYRSMDGAAVMFGSQKVLDARPAEYYELFTKVTRGPDFFDHTKPIGYAPFGSSFPGINPVSFTAVRNASVRVASGGSNKKVFALSQNYVVSQTGGGVLGIL